MERIPIRITALLVMTTLAACDFLDIDTPGIVNRDKMFENEQGFIDAMNGVYASMADADLYGEQLSFGFVDEIAQLYYNDYEANETTLTKTFDLRYRDEDVRPQIDAIWSKAYNTIASANSVLDNISGHDFAILPRIRGEALTVRAFLHFDLLRLFAPNIERGDEQAIPYVEHFSISPVERSTVREVYERIVADLTEAYGLLRDAQPASGRTPEELYVSQYAAAALLARVCNWGGDHETAERYALEALKGPFAFIREEQIKNLFLGYTARTECIWGLHAPDMYLDVRSRLYPTRLTDELDMVRDNYQTIFRVSSFTSTNNDYRYQSYFTRTKWEHSVVLLTKFYDKYYDEEQIVPSGRIPGPNLVRLPELYYILAESVYDRDPAAALEYLNTVVTARGLHPIEAADIATPASFREELLNEIMKEFWGEGQIFATYKRFNLPMEGVNGTSSGASPEHPATDDTYLLPLPESEESAGID